MIYKKLKGEVFSYGSLEEAEQFSHKDSIYLNEEEVQEHLRNNSLSTEASTKTQIKTQRDFILSSTDWIVVRHRDEIENETSTSISTEEYKQVQKYRQDLRDITQNENWWDQGLPEPPLVLKEIVQKYKLT